MSFNLNLILKDNHVFSKRTFSPEEVVYEFKGDVISREAMQHVIPTKLYDYYLQIDKDLFLGPSGDYDDYFNHSCFPNCGVKITGKRAFLISLYQINPGIEITFDYSTVSTDAKEQWLMDCQCNKFNCREQISGYHSLPEIGRAHV
jgi:hypothetical protein